MLTGENDPDAQDVTLILGYTSAPDVVLSPHGLHQLIKEVALTPPPPPGAGFPKCTLPA
jgi:hypothetical protein